MFGVSELTALFTASSLRTAAGTTSGLALATLVYAHTGSPLLSAVTLFGGSFAQVVGAATLLSAADRMPPRSALTVLGTVFTLTTFVMAVPAMPVAALLGLQLGTGLAAAAGSGILWGLLDEIVPEGGYILARSLFNISVGVMQITGFALGDTLIAVASPRGALLLAALLYLLSTLFVRFGLSGRPPRASGRMSIRLTWAVNAELWAPRPRRAVFLALWVPNGLIVGCEALFIPYSPHAAGALFVAAAVGMLAGDTALGRFVPVRWWPRLISPLLLLLAAPYLLFALRPPLQLALTAIAVASFGYSASLLLQERLVSLTPAEIRGQSFGLMSSGMLTMQALGATLAGAIAEHLSVVSTMTIMAVASTAVTIVLTPRLLQPPPRVIAAETGEAHANS